MAIKITYDLKTDVKILNSRAFKSANTLKKAVQIAAVANLAHAQKTNDYSECTNLVNGLGHGVRAESLIAYFVKFGGLSFIEPTKDNPEGRFKGWKGADYIKDNFQEAKAKMWFDCNKKNPWKGFDLYKGIEALVNQHNSAMKKQAALIKAGEEVPKIDTDPEVIRVLEGLSKGLSIEVSMSPMIDDIELPEEQEEAGVVVEMGQEIQRLEQHLKEA